MYWFKVSTTLSSIVKGQASGQDSGLNYRIFCPAKTQKVLLPASVHNPAVKLRSLLGSAAGDHLQFEPGAGIPEKRLPVLALAGKVGRTSSYRAHWTKARTLSDKFATP